MDVRILIFLSVVSLILALATTYVGKRLIQPSALGRRGRQVAWALLILCPVVGLVAFTGGRLIERSQFTNHLYIVGFSGLGVLGTFVPLLLVRDLLLLFSRRRRSTHATADEQAAMLSRRQFLTRSSGRVVVGATGAAVTAGVVQAARGPEVIEVDVPIEALPPALEGYRIAQVSDLHVGPVLDQAWLTEVVALVQGVKPDLVAVTGDLVDGRVAELLPLLAPLRDLDARDGAYFVTGNHEYYWDGPAWAEAVASLGLTVLGNAHRLVERDGARLLVAGVHDYRAASIEPTHACDPAAALAGAPTADVRLLLAHQPKTLHAARDLPYDLMLSGHTHGGQLFPWNLLLHLVQPVVAGLHRFGSMQVYVNRGTGWWGPPMRSPARSEVTLLRLVKA